MGATQTFLIFSDYGLVAKAGIADRSVWVSKLFSGEPAAGIRVSLHDAKGAELPGKFTKADIDQETQSQWYLRQMLGSANIDGGKLMDFMSGNLSYQIEHHLFPDLPSNRYQEIAPKVQDLFARYGLRYTTGPLPVQVASAWRKVVRLSLPNDFVSDAKADPVGTVTRLVRRPRRRTPAARAA